MRCHLYSECVVYTLNSIEMYAHLTVLQNYVSGDHVNKNKFKKGGRVGKVSNWK